MIQSSVNLKTTVDHKYVEICQLSQNNCNNLENYTPNNNASLGYTGTLTISQNYWQEYCCYGEDYNYFLGICNPFNLSGNFTMYFTSTCNMEITLTHQIKQCNQSRTYTITNGTQISLKLYPSDEVSYYISVNYEGQIPCNQSWISAEIFLGFVPS